MTELTAKLEAAYKDATVQAAALQDKVGEDEKSQDQPATHSITYRNQRLLQPLMRHACGSEISLLMCVSGWLQLTLQEKELVSAKQALTAAQSSSDKALADLKAQMAQAEMDRQASEATQVSRGHRTRRAAGRLGRSVC